MIYWCKKCKVPIFDRGLHSCSCDGKITKISESSIYIENYIDSNRIGGLLVKSTIGWESAKGPLIRHAISVILEEFLKEHTECYYK